MRLQAYDVIHGNDMTIMIKHYQTVVLSHIVTVSFSLAFDQYL